MQPYILLDLLSEAWILMNAIAFAFTDEDSYYYIFANFIIVLPFELSYIHNNKKAIALSIYLTALFWISSDERALIYGLVYLSIRVSIHEYTRFEKYILNLILPSFREQKYLVDNKWHHLFFRSALLFPIVLFTSLPKEYVDLFCSLYLIVFSFSIEYPSKKLSMAQIQSIISAPSFGYSNILFSIIQFSAGKQEAAYQLFLFVAYMLSNYIITKQIFPKDDILMRKDFIFKSNFLTFYIPRGISAFLLLIGFAFLNVNLAYIVQFILNLSMILFILYDQSIKLQCQQQYPAPIFVKSISSGLLIQILQDRASYSLVQIIVNPNLKIQQNNNNLKTYGEFVDEELESLSLETQITLLQTLLKYQQLKKPVTVNDNSGQILQVTESQFNVFNFIEAKQLTEILCNYITSPPIGLDYSKFNTEELQSIYISFKWIFGDDCASQIDVDYQTKRIGKQVRRIKLIHTAFFKQIQSNLTCYPSYVFLDLYLETKANHM